MTKGWRIQYLLTDENGNLLDESELHLYGERSTRCSTNSLNEQDEIPDYRMYMADGFRESHGYTENGEIGDNTDCRTHRNPSDV